MSCGREVKTPDKIRFFLFLAEEETKELDKGNYSAIASAGKRKTNLTQRFWTSCQMRRRLGDVEEDRFKFKCAAVQQIKLMFVFSAGDEEDEFDFHPGKSQILLLS